MYFKVIVCLVILAIVPYSYQGQAESTQKEEGAETGAANEPATKAATKATTKGASESATKSTTKATSKAATEAAIDYCNNMKCPKKPHVACKSPAANGGWGPACPKDRDEIDFTPELENSILKIHNTQRNQQALGKTPNYKSAARLGTLVYNRVLAEMARYNVRLCKYGHDNCRNTKEFPVVGQNIALAFANITAEEIVKTLTPNWFDKEHMNGKTYGWMKMINSFPNLKPEPQVGHFTQVIWEDAVAIGCAASRYTDKTGSKSLLVCNYGYGNMEGNHVYEAGPAASKCKTGKNPDYPGLCSIKENYTESILSRSGWDLKPFSLPGGGISWKVPPGCDDDVECRKMQADPIKFFQKDLAPADMEAKVTFGSDGTVQFSFSAGCDQAFRDKFMADFKKKHPEYN